MPSKQQEKQPTDGDKQARQQLTVAIGQHVMHTLGQPNDLRGVQVRRLWENHYRVNVLIGTDAASARVANSYFLVTDGDGNIVASTPKIARQY
jgi:predicted NBD/HSP70 family sugar kinase